MAYNGRQRRDSEIIQKELKLEKQLVDAALDGDFEAVKYCIENGASADAAEYNKSLFYASQNYITPLQNATQAGFSTILHYLIERGGTIPIHFILNFKTCKR